MSVRQSVLVALAAGCGALTAQRLPISRSPTGVRSGLGQLSAVWSDSRAVEDYQNLLAGKQPERKADLAGVVVGGCELSRLYAELAPSTPDRIIGTDGEIPLKLDAETYPNLDDEALGSFPIYVFAEADALDDVVARCPASKKEDLVFMHARGEMVEPVLRSHGCFRDSQTQVVLYLAVNEYSKLECERVSIGTAASNGEEKWAAETAVTGKWAGAVADRLAKHDLHCSELFQRDWRRQMFERCVFESVFGLVGLAHKNVPVSEVYEFFAEEVDDMLYELQRGLRGHLALTLLNGVEERMAAYAKAQFRSKKDNRLATLKANDKWRNAFFYEISKTALASNFPDPSPMHTEYWDYAIQNDLLDR